MRKRHTKSSSMAIAMLVAVLLGVLWTKEPMSLLNSISNLTGIFPWVSDISRNTARTLSNNQNQTPYIGSIFYDDNSGTAQTYDGGGWTQIGGAPDPVPAETPYRGGQVLGATSGGGGGGRATSGGSGMTAAQANDIYSMLDQNSRTVNEQLARLDTQSAIGNSNIDTNYNLASNRLMENQGIANRNFGIQRDQTTQDNVLARNNIDSRVRSRSTGLQRLLGNAGSGNSSAALYAAPRAAALEGTQLRQGVDRTFGRNMSSIDMAQGDSDRQYNNSRSDLVNQRDQKRNELSSGIAQTRASLLEQLANIGVQRAQAGGQTYQQALAARAPFDSQITNLLMTIDNLGRLNPVMQAAPVNFAAPNLAQYSTGQMATPQMVADNPAVADIASPFWSLLNRDRQRQAF